MPLSVFVNKTSSKSVVLFFFFRESYIFLIAARRSSTYLFQVLISLLLVTDLISRSCMTASKRKLERGTPIGVPEICL